MSEHEMCGFVYLQNNNIWLEVSSAIL